MEPKMLANWDFQQDPEWKPSPEQTSWWESSKLRHYEYVYKAEFWQNEAGQRYAVLFTYGKHPLTGARYILRRHDGNGVAAVNDPIVVALNEFPPGVA